MVVRTVSTAAPVRFSHPKTLTKAMVAFRESPYTLADAKVVKTKMNLANLHAGKEFIGNSILTGKESQLEAIGVTRSLIDDQDCLARFNRSGFTRSDVRAAKQSFGFLRTSTAAEIKTYLGLKLRNLESGYPDGMKMLEEAGITESKYDRHEQFDAFKAAKLNDRNVRVAKEKFDFLKSTSDQDTKEYLGLKVINAKDGSDYAKDFLKQIGAAGW